MLPSVNKFLHTAYVKKHGSVGIYCDRSRICAAHLTNSMEPTRLDYDLDVTTDAAFYEQFKTVLKAYERRPVPIYIGVGPEECSYDVIQLSGLPKDKRPQRQFIQWRYQKLFGRALSKSDFAYSIVQVQGTRNFVAVSDGSEIVAQVKKAVVDTNAVVMWLGPSTAAYPSLFRRASSENNKYSVLVLITHNGWTLLVTGETEPMFCRSGAWGESRAALLEQLAKDVVTTQRYFANIWDHSQSFPVYILNLSWESADTDLLRNRLSDAKYSDAGAWMNRPDQPAMSAMAIAARGYE